MYLQSILFDFDGVIVDSEDIRVMGFKEIFKNEKQANIDKLIEYHLQNGGISRYEKFKWYYKHILKEPIENDTIDRLGERFKRLMLNNMSNKKILINETLDFIKYISRIIPIHVVSGSDQAELREICRMLNIDEYFTSITGSPKKKSILIKNLLKKYAYDSSKVIYIGDSLIDLKSSKSNKLTFIGYNNKSLATISDLYLEEINYIYKIISYEKEKVILNLPKYKLY